MLYCLGLSKCSKCKNTKNYQIKQEIRAFILNFGDYCLFYAVLDYSGFASSELSGRQYYE